MCNCKQVAHGQYVGIWANITEEGYSMNLTLLKKQIDISNLPESRILEFESLNFKAKYRELKCIQLDFKLPFVCLFKDGLGDHGMVLTKNSEVLEIEDEQITDLSNNKFLLSSLYVTREIKMKYVEYYKEIGKNVQLDILLRGIYGTSIACLFNVRQNLYLRHNDGLLDLAENKSYEADQVNWNKFEKVLINEDFFFK